LRVNCSETETFFTYFDLRGLRPKSGFVFTASRRGDTGRVPTTPSPSPINTTVILVEPAPLASLRQWFSIRSLNNIPAGTESFVALASMSSLTARIVVPSSGSVGVGLLDPPQRDFDLVPSTSLSCKGPRPIQGLASCDCTRQLPKRSEGGGNSTQGIEGHQLTHATPPCSATDEMRQIWVHE
ncbi:hypothetical protein FRC07_012030, partial [Ceratobasidium sp. 392]